MYCKHSQEGYSLLETVVYVAVFAVFSVVVVNSLIVVTGTFLNIRTERTVNNTASVALDRIVRETRLANSVDTLNSTFDVNPGRLTLNTTDSMGGATTVEFYIENGRLKVKEGGVVSGALTSSSVVIDSAIFRLVTNGSAQAVKMEFALHDSRDKTSVTKYFYNTALLRGSY